MSARVRSSMLEVSDLNLDLGGFSLREVNLTCRRGEHHVLLGPTGSGKSTLMRCLLGLQRVLRGKMLVDGEEVSHLPPERRNMGYVPQNYALFPHLDVEHNIRFGVVARGGSGEEGLSLDQLCGLLGILHLRKRSVRHLSGGERQKVALARALAPRPAILLLDEPFSSIDEGSRRRLWFELKEVIEEVGVTALHITHSLEEACAMGDRLSVMIRGHIAQTATSAELLQRPASPEVARLLNYRNLFTGTARRHGAGTVVDLGCWRVALSRSLPSGEPVQICIRPQDVKILKEDAPLRRELAKNAFTCEVRRVFELTDTSVAWLRPDTGQPSPELEVRFPAHLRARHNLRLGRRIRVALYEPGLIAYLSDGTRA